MSAAKRYHLALDPKLFEELRSIAASEELAVVDLMRRFVKLGITAVNLERSGEGELIIRRGDEERGVKLLWTEMQEFRPEDEEAQEQFRR